MATSVSQSQAELLSLRDCDYNLKRLRECYVALDPATESKKKAKIMVEIDSWLDTRLFVAALERR